MTRLHKIILVTSSVLVIAAHVLLSVLITFELTVKRYRQIKYFIVVEDSLYEAQPNLFVVNKSLCADEEDCSGEKKKEPGKTKNEVPDIEFAKESQVPVFTRFGKKDSIPVVAAYISQEKKLLLTGELTSGPLENVSELVYVKQYRDILPTVEADFKNPDSQKNSLLNPELTITFSDAASLEKGRRALSIDGMYAGNSEYPLREETRVRIKIYAEPLKELIKIWADTIFSGGTEKEISVLKQKIKKPVFIASVGDLMLARGTEEILMYEKDGLNKVFCDTLPLLQNSDFTIGNLEGAVTRSTKNATKAFTFKFNEKVLPKLQEAGFDYLMLTNNHCYDYGEAGFRDTLKAFKKYGVNSSGVGYNQEEARNFFYTNINGQEFAVISCGAYPIERSGFNGNTMSTATETRAGILWQGDEILKLVETEKSKGKFVVVNVHGGEEYQFIPSKNQRKFYESLCDRGADVIFGSHPHVLQPTEWYGKSLIVYSMGNFIFNGMSSMYRAEESEVVKLGVLDGRVVYVEQYPVHLHENSVYRIKN